MYNLSSFIVGFNEVFETIKTKESKVSNSYAYVICRNNTCQQTHQTIHFAPNIVEEEFKAFYNSTRTNQKENSSMKSHINFEMMVTVIWSTLIGYLKTLVE